jgi:iron(III)-enterobactin esterase
MKIKVTLLIHLFFLVNITMGQEILKFISVKKTNFLEVWEASITSKKLKRQVDLSIIIPTGSKGDVPILLMNDGQDIPSLNYVQTLDSLFLSKKVTPFITVGIHANQDRMAEYGTVSQPDSKGRGAKAKAFSDFIMAELVPNLKKNEKFKSENFIYAGFSLGGLSAIDIAWANPKIFKKVGVFSGSLWWRQKELDKGYTDEKDRIMHNIIRGTSVKPNLKIWLEAGTNDEKSDRNQNGIIDAIDDTLDLIKELKIKGFNENKDVFYQEIIGGEHNQKTWGKIMPDFLIWAFGK